MTPAEERQAERKERIAGKVAAMQALLRGDTDARDWLTATGMTTETGCTCPYCQPAA